MKNLIENLKEFGTKNKRTLIYVGLILLGLYFIYKGAPEFMEGFKEGMKEK